MFSESEIQAMREAIRRAFLDELLPLIQSVLGRIESQPTTLLSRDEAAQLLGVSVQTVATLIREGTMPHVKIRRRVLIPRQAICDYMEQASGSSRKEERP